MNAKSEEIFDMQGYINVMLIDDDSNIAEELNRRLPSVFFETINIDTIIEGISKQKGGIFADADLIFIDTFYGDDRTDYYALDFFEEYTQINSKTNGETKGKEFVLVCIDDVNKRLYGEEKVWMECADERTRLMALMGKVRNHPYLEWGGNKKTNKIDRIVEAIEKYAQKNKIYLYKKREMTFDEWIKYIISLMKKTQTLINDIQGTEVQSTNSGITIIMESLRDIIARARIKLNLDSEELGNNYGDIRTILEAINFAQEYCREVDTQIQDLKLKGTQFHNRRLMDLAHHFNNLIVVTNMQASRQKTKILRDKDRTD